MINANQSVVYAAKTLKMSEKSNLVFCVIIKRSNGDDHFFQSVSALTNFQ